MGEICVYPLTEFAGFSASDARRIYPTINKLFLFRASSGGNSDALCLNCKEIKLKCKAKRLVKHALSCKGPDLKK